MTFINVLLIIVSLFAFAWSLVGRTFLYIFDSKVYESNLLKWVNDDGNEQNKPVKPKPGKTAPWVLLGVLSIAVFLFALSFVIIPTGYTGVRTTFGQIDENTLPNGYNWKIPFVQTIEKVNNKQKDAYFEDTVWGETDEQIPVKYESITVTYRVNPEKSAWIFANVSDYDRNLVSQSVVESAMRASSKTLSDNEATNRDIIERVAKDKIQAAFDEKYGAEVLLIDKVTVGNADFEDDYNKAISERQKAKLESEKQAIENEKSIEKAKADAEVKRQNAQAEADAKMIRAQADADANKLLEESLTPNVLKNKWLEEWDGVAPKVVSDGNYMVGIE